MQKFISYVLKASIFVLVIFGVFKVTEVLSQKQQAFESKLLCMAAVVANPALVQISEKDGKKSIIIPNFKSAAEACKEW